MRTIRPLLAVALGGTLGLTACSNDAGSPENADSGSATSSGSGTATSPGETGGTVSLSVTDDPGNLDPAMTVLSVTRAVTRPAYDSLVRRTPDGEIAPSLATDWEVSPTSVTFTMGQEATCSDGTPFTATDAADNISFIADPDNASPLLGVYVPADITAAADDEAGTVTVEVSEPNVFLLGSLSNVYMVCRSGLDDRESLAQGTAGTGPWVLDEVAPNDSYTFSRNADYSWGPSQEPYEGEGVPDTLVYRIIPNMTTTANLLLAGDVNIAAVGASESERVQAAGLDSREVAAPQGEMFFNQSADRPGADPMVRQALIAATNRELVAQVGGGDVGRPSTGLVTLEPKACPGDTVAGNLPDFDPAAATSMLEEAGWVAGSDGIREKDGQRLSMTFIYPQSGGDDVAAAAELLSQQWLEVGAEIELQSIAATQLNEVLFASGAWDAGWVPITVDLPTQLVPFLSGATPPDGTNFAHIDNEEYAAASASALTADDVDAACASWTEAEVALISDAAVAPMFDVVNRTYLNGVTIDMPAGEIDGSSIRTTS